MEPGAPDQYRRDGLAPRQPAVSGGGTTIWSMLTTTAGTVVAWVAAAAVFSALAIAAGLIWLTWTLRTWRRR